MNLDKRITGAIVLLVLATAVILIAVFALDDGDGASATDPNDPFAIEPVDEDVELPEPLFPGEDFAIVQTFSVISTETGDTLTATLNDDMLSWTLDTVPEGADITLVADDARLGAVGYTLPDFTPTRTLDNPGDLARFGLINPLYTITFILDNGNEHTMVVGSKAPASSAYYVQADGEEDVVHLLAATSLDPALNLVTDPPLLEPTPTPEGTPADDGDA
jgi:hypothetical protein